MDSTPHSGRTTVLSPRVGSGSTAFVSPPLHIHSGGLSPRSHSKSALSPHLPLNDEFVTHVFPDFGAVEYFQKDFDSAQDFYIAEEAEVSGLDVYLVEQWLAWRRISSVITTFTGNTDSKAAVVKFTTRRRPLKAYPPRFQEYLNELAVNHAKQKTIDEKHSSRKHSGESSANVSAGESSPASPIINSPILGIAFVPRANLHHEIGFVTNLASLPPELNLVPIPNGNLRTVKNNVVININLKRLQCAGRSVELASSRFTDSTENKFRLMFCIHGLTIPFRFAVRELVNIVQTCLFYFELLDPKYCDGFLCDKTCEAMTQWWNLFGLPYMGARRQDKEGILSPRTAAAIISMILSIRLRLQLVGGCDVAKDPFDFESFMLSIGHFQKRYDLEKRRKLDVETVEKLYAVTNVTLLRVKHTNRKLKSGHVPLDEATSVSDASVPDKGNRLKKKQKHYTNEFRKLKSAVKNTVQDKMNGDDDQAATGDGTVPFNHKMAKLADNANPLDVETLDLDYLVRSYMIGSTLMRLFYGVQGPSSFFSETVSQDSRIGLGRRSRDRSRGALLGDVHSDAEVSGYHFMSLKDQIVQRRDSSDTVMPPDMEVSRHPRKRYRMKLGLQRRGGRHHSGHERVNLANINNMSLSTEHGSYAEGRASSGSDSDPEPNFDDAAFSLKRDSFRKVRSLGLSRPQFLEKPIREFNLELNRRNSFPATSPHDMNLNVLDTLRQHRTLADARPVSSFPQSMSDSNLEIYFASRSCHREQFTVSALTRQYLRVVEKLDHYDCAVKAYKSDSVSAGEFEYARRACLKFNNGVIRLENAQHTMDAGQARLLDGDIKTGLEHSYNEMLGMIDRLVYEARLVEKQVTEVEENYRLMDLKLREQCESRLKLLIAQVVALHKFYMVFSDPQERAKILGELGTVEHPVPPILKTAELFNIVVIFFYKLGIKILRFLKLDGTNFNTERIRRSWGKVDPNGKIMDRANSIVGRRGYLELSGDDLAPPSPEAHNNSNNESAVDEA